MCGVHVVRIRDVLGVWGVRVCMYNISVCSLWCGRGVICMKVYGVLCAVYVLYILL